MEKNLRLARLVVQITDKLTEKPTFGDSTSAFGLALDVNNGQSFTGLWQIDENARTDKAVSFSDFIERLNGHWTRSIQRGEMGTSFMNHEPGTDIFEFFVDVDYFAIRGVDVMNNGLVINTFATNPQSALTPIVTQPTQVSECTAKGDSVPMDKTFTAFDPIVDQTAFYS